jgi:glycosyltransferase involved in cell wall biosynthesis
MAKSQPSTSDQARVVFLVNFLSPNLVAVFREVSTQVKQLEILVSVPVEANRQWEPDFADLTVTIQKTRTSRRVVKHPGGYEEELFVHFPLDTFQQLCRLQPDCVVSLEMGMRSLMSVLYRRLWNRKSRHVLAVYGSERSEAGRGRMRRGLRRFLLSAADVITYNGPSCQRYLLSMGACAEKMLPWNYAADPTKAYRGELKRYSNQPLLLLTVSQLISRKGVLPAAQQLNQWALLHPSQAIEWAIAGTGPQASELSNFQFAPNLKLHLLGHQNPEQLRQLYCDYPVHLFPTLGDEWGLALDEALASGQLVLGSFYSQAAATLIEPGKNGWQFDPEQNDSLVAVLDQLMQTDPTTVAQMRSFARLSVSKRTHIESAEQFLAAVSRALRS